MKIKFIVFMCIIFGFNYNSFCDNKESSSNKNINEIFDDPKKSKKSEFNNKSDENEKNEKLKNKVEMTWLESKIDNHPLIFVVSILALGLVALYKQPK